jgi:hypothetical protein
MVWIMSGWRKRQIQEKQMPIIKDDYERGVIDGMQKQAQSSVDKAVNAMAQRTWVGLTDEEIDELHGSPMSLEHSGELKWVRIIEAKLKEKNT